MKCVLYRIATDDSLSEENFFATENVASFYYSLDNTEGFSVLGHYVVSEMLTEDCGGEIPFTAKIGTECVYTSSGKMYKVLKYISYRGEN